MADLPDIPTLTSWRVRRSGSGLTITGQDQHGAERRFAGVFEICQTMGRPGYFARLEGGGRIAELTND